MPAHQAKLSVLQEFILDAAWCQRIEGRVLFENAVVSEWGKLGTGRRTMNSVAASVSCACRRLLVRGLIRIDHKRFRNRRGRVSRFAVIELTETGVAAAEDILGAKEVERLGKLAARRKRDAARRRRQRAARELKRRRRLRAATRRTDKRVFDFSGEATVSDDQPWRPDDT